ncbi:MAG: dTMP kinase [Pseudomonadota bacterium]
MTNGFFITFEGGEGVGKTTQIKHLSERLEKQGHDTVQTREPGGTPHAESIRNLLGDTELGPTWDNESELFMFSAARSMHVKDIIQPALNSGKIVVCDRYTDSTQVYQGIDQGLPDDLMQTAIRYGSKNIYPNLTFILDLPAEEGLRRVKERGIRDHYDEQDEDFYEKIRQGFLSIADKEPERCVIINAMRDEQTIASEIESVTLERLGDV